MIHRSIAAQRQAAVPHQAMNSCVGHAGRLFALMAQRKPESRAAVDFGQNHFGCWSALGAD
jgi:hypothetical protein